MSGLDDHDVARLVYLAGLIALISGGVVAAYRFQALRAVRDLLIWGLIIAGLVIVYGFRDVLTRELSPAPVARVGADAIALRRGPDGHFRAPGDVNGAEVLFLIDTGASDVVLAPGDARAAGLDPGALVYSGRARTAAGVAPTAPVRLDSLRVGPFTERGVRAVVMRDGLDTSLLGVSWLERFRSWRVEGDSMILTR